MTGTPRSSQPRHSSSAARAAWAEARFTPTSPTSHMPQPMKGSLNKLRLASHFISHGK